jgi:UDP-glucose 4-epimerase
MKTVLITGSAGFLGRHLTRALDDAGYAITSIDRGDGLDARDFFRQSSDRFDLVVHAAAAGADRASIDGSPLVLAANFELDAGLFGWAARTRPGRVVYLSSSAAYPVVLQQPGSDYRLRERDISLRHPQQPDGIYGWCKLTGERLAALARDAGVPVTVVRPFSGYGEDQGERFPFGALAARAVRREDPFVIWGTGEQVRDFIHVDDIVAAVTTMAEQGIDGPVNLGTGRPTALLSLAGMACEAAGYKTVTWEAHPEKPAGVACRVADITAMSEFCTPKVTLEEGVARAVCALVAA